MRQFAHGTGIFQLFFNTDFNEEEIRSKFNGDSIIKIDLQMTLADGSVHTIEGFEPKIDWLHFEEDERKL
ncbi:hypothetical protein [Bacillus smithii]|uniref:hypothetical protein n=1 Tax=Bacillus smithii TaxID=1479 RepID=UPI002E1CAAEA|nr:hypothetical protein [Bacillus smithii]MED4929147.1 hypothetical protein [Bacillus smithii]